MVREERQVHADAGYTGVEQRPEIVALAHKIGRQIAGKLSLIKALAEGAEKEARKAVEKELDTNIGKFTGFMGPASPLLPNLNGFPSSVTGSGSLPVGSTGKSNGNSPGKTANAASNNSFTNIQETNTTSPSAPPMVPVLSQNSPTFPTVPTESGVTPVASPPGADDKKLPLPPEATVGKPTLLSGIPKLAAVDGLMSSIVAQLPKGPVSVSASPLPLKPTLLGERTVKAAEADKARKNGVRLGQTGPSGAENFGVAGEGAGEWPTTVPAATGSWMGSAMDWLLSALGLKDSAASDDEGKGLADSEPYLRTAGEFGDIAGTLDSPFGPKSRNRVIASVVEKTGMSVRSASRLYYGALYAAWSGTVGLLAFALRRMRRKTS